MTKYGIPVLAALVLALAAVSIARLRPVRASAAPPSQPPKAAYATQVGAVGLVEAKSENISIGVPLAGLVMQVDVKAGDHVRKGQKLFSLDDRDLRSELALRKSSLEVARAKLQKLLDSPRPEDVPPAEARVSEAEQQLADAEVQLRLIEGVKDRRAIREEDLERRRIAVKAAKARLEEARANLGLLKAGSWAPDIHIAQSEVAEAERQVSRVQADLDRLTVTAPVDGEILNCNVRAGEYAPAGVLPQPLIVMGTVDELHVRADVDEEDASRVKAGAAAIASARGDGSHQYPLRFVRFEPLVRPKRNLTGDGTERVDTRVLQVIFALDRQAPVYVGQQMDVFIQAGVAK